MNTFETLRTERVVEGAGAIQHIAAEVERRGLSKVFVLSGRSVAQTSEFTDAVSALGSRVAGVDSSIRAHNPLNGLLDLVSRVRDAGADGLISVGGGSPVDAAKLISLCTLENITAREELLEYTISRGLKPFNGDALIPVFAVPTTLSAAEWNGVAAFVDEQEQTKELVKYVSLTPRTIFLDPALAAHTPRELWMQTGVRAVDHAIETMLATVSHPTTTALATGALEILTRDLKASSQDAADFSAVLRCQQAAWMSLQGVHNVPMGLSHSIGHQLGAAGIPHGATTSIVLPHVVYLFEDATPSQLNKVAAILASARGATTSMGAGKELEMFFDDLGAPRTIREFGVEREQLPGIAEICMKEAQTVITAAPKAVTHDDILDILNAAY